MSPICSKSSQKLMFLCEQIGIKELKIKIRKDQSELTKTIKTVANAIEHSRSLHILHIDLSSRSPLDLMMLVRSMLLNTLRRLHLKRFYLFTWAPNHKEKSDLTEVIYLLSCVDIERINFFGHTLHLDSSLMVDSACKLLKSCTLQSLYKVQLHSGFAELAPTYLDLDINSFTPLNDLISTIPQHPRLETLKLDDTCKREAEFCINCQSQSQNTIDLIIAVCNSKSHMREIKLNYDINREFAFILLERLGKEVDGVVRIRNNEIYIVRPFRRDLMLDIWNSSQPPLAKEEMLTAYNIGRELSGKEAVLGV
ncbi:hypothetical protein HK098_000265 [Nowakowskiella sp. JEL0407]|nr:hypothetical protein HK098_000265 [Nowakowskiella sp. JEL0407]